MIRNKVINEERLYVAGLVLNLLVGITNTLSLNGIIDVLLLLIMMNILRKNLYINLRVKIGVWMLMMKWKLRLFNGV